MRVIHQLIAYFHARGALSDDQLADLRRSGFLGGEEPGRGVPGVSDDELAADRIRSRAAARVEARGALGGDTSYRVPRAVKPLGVAPLCRQLSGLSTGWPRQLGAFFAIADALEPEPSLRRSLLLIRNADGARLTSVLQELLARREIRLWELDMGLDVQDYRWVLRPGKQPTRALSAYRALMRTYDFGSLGKYAWVLRHDPVNDVFNLVQAKRAVLRALRELFAQDRRALTLHLRGQAATNLFWAFVILRSALADDPWIEARRKTSRNVSYLDKIWPPQAVLQRAALYALFMAPAPVLAFLTRDLDVPSDARGNPPWAIPRDWTSDAEKHYINFRRRDHQ